MRIIALVLAVLSLVFFLAAVGGVIAFVLLAAAVICLSLDGALPVPAWPHRP